MALGELFKLKITAFRDIKYSEKVADGVFTSLLNPEKYTLAYKIEYNDDQAAGSSGNDPRFEKMPLKDLDLEFLFDRTGIIAHNQNQDKDAGVVDDIQQFKEVAFEYSGDEHRLYYLEIRWGSLLFKGILIEMNIEYKLFNPQGTPLRAVIKAKFKETVDPELRLADENRNSPDLTHIRIVESGDTLPLMAFRIYGDSKYYLQVAQANGITNFRTLKPGQKIFFPPIIEKTI